MSYSVAGLAVQGTPYREAQVCLGPSYANAYYLFFLTGTSTPANVYANGTLTTAFPTGNRVTADVYGRFPAIWLDPSVTYRVQLYTNIGTLVRQSDPYISTLSTVGTSSLSAFGFSIAPTGELTLNAPNTGGTGTTLTLNAGALGTAALQITGTLAGNSALIINNSATTGAQNATFTATNKPGTAASSPAGWLPITCDGVQYYTPIWHGNNFTPYVANPSALGETIVGKTVNFAGNGLTTVTGGSASPSNWFAPTTGSIGAGYYINITKTGGLSGVPFLANVTLTAAPSGATYTGGTLTANWVGQTASTYTVVTSSGQVITGCTLTNGSTAFTCPSTNITGTNTTTLSVNVAGKWINITSSGLTILSDAQATINGTYQLSSSISGSPIVANGTIQLANNNGVQQPTYNGNTPLVLAGNGTATLNGVSTSNWYTPTTANIGTNYWISINQTGGTSGTTFTGVSGYTNITSGGLTIGVTGGSGSTYATGTYIIAADSAGVNQLASGTITINGSNITSANWSGTTPLNLAGNGTATLNGVSTSNWYSPTTSNVGSGYYINITRTGGTAGVSFSAAQGSWTNITNSGLSIGLSGTSGNVGTVTANGTYQISSSNTGTPVLGSGTISLSLSGLTVVHVYNATSGATSVTETFPSGTSNVVMEIWGGGANGGSGGSSGGGGGAGGGGGGGGYSRSSYASSGGKTVIYSYGAQVPAIGFGGLPANGNNSSISSGTLTITTMTANGGAAGSGGSGGTGGNGGAGGSASGGNVANTTGGAGTAGTNGTSGVGGTGGKAAVGVNYNNPQAGVGQASNGGAPNLGAGAGAQGAAVFYYT